MPPDLTSRTRFPTQVGYSLIGGGVGMLMACQLFALHDIDVPDTSLFGYGCHEEESKPIMRGMLHTVAAVVCFLTMILQYLAVGSTRHPSDFVMAYFGMQYLASAIYHRQRWSATIVSTFTIVDMGWIAFTILGSSYMMKLKKVRYVFLIFVTFVSLAFLYEVVAHGLPSEHASIELGDYLVNVEMMKDNVFVKHFVYSLSFDPWVWVACKTLSGISFALIPFFSPIALNFSTYTREQKVLYFLCINTFLLSFVCFGLQTASRSGLELKLFWHVKNVWGFHEDFHLILVMAHTFTSQMYDLVYDSSVASTPRETLQNILNRINEEYEEEYEAFQYISDVSRSLAAPPAKSLSGINIRQRMAGRIEEMKALRERLSKNIDSYTKEAKEVMSSGMKKKKKKTGARDESESGDEGEAREARGRVTSPARSRSKEPAGKKTATKARSRSKTPSRRSTRSAK